MASESKAKWDVNKTCKLIELYRENPSLWDPKNWEYKNKFKKCNVLRNISITLNVSVDEIEKKLKNLNSQYMRERRNCIKMNKSGADTQFHSKWFGYGLLSFLRSKNKAGENLQALSVEDEVSFMHS